MSNYVFKARSGLQDNAPAALMILPLLIFLVVFYAFPFAEMLVESLRPWSNDPEEVRSAGLSLYQYEKVFNSARIMRALSRTFEISFIAVFITFLISYPIALLMLWLKPKICAAFLIIIFVSLAASLIVRNYGWLVVLADQGPVNNIMVALGFFEHSKRLVYNEWAIIMALVHYSMPFMILPIYGSLLRIPDSQWEVPLTLGANTWTALRTVILPLSAPGIFGGTTLCFAVCASAFVTPLMLGSPATSMISQVAAEQLLIQLNFPLGSAIIFVLTAITFLLILIYALFVRKVLRVDV